MGRPPRSWRRSTSTRRSCYGCRTLIAQCARCCSTRSKISNLVSSCDNRTTENLLEFELLLAVIEMSRLPRASQQQVVVTIADRHLGSAREAIDASQLPQALQMRAGLAIATLATNCLPGFLRSSLSDGTVMDGPPRHWHSEPLQPSKSAVGRVRGPCGRSRMAVLDRERGREDGCQRKHKRHARRRQPARVRQPGVLPNDGL